MNPHVIPSILLQGAAMKKIAMLFSLLFTLCLVCVPALWGAEHRRFSNATDIWQGGIVPLSTDNVRILGTDSV